MMNAAGTMLKNERRSRSGSTSTGRAEAAMRERPTGRSSSESGRRLMRRIESSLVLLLRYWLAVSALHLLLGTVARSRNRACVPRPGVVERRVDRGTKTDSVWNCNFTSVQCHPSYPRVVDCPAPLKGPGNHSVQTFFSRSAALVVVARWPLALLRAAAGAGLLLLRPGLLGGLLGGGGRHWASPLLAGAVHPPQKQNALIRRLP